MIDFLYNFKKILGRFSWAKKIWYNFECGKKTDFFLEESTNYILRLHSVINQLITYLDYILLLNFEEKCMYCSGKMRALLGLGTNQLFRRFSKLQYFPLQIKLN